MSTIGTTAALRARIAGAVVEPSDEGYETARKVYNGSIDRRPAAIVRCTSAEDVSTALQFAKTVSLPVAVRGGGHSGPGFGTCDGGIVIDLSGMRQVDVDPAKETITAQGGCTWGDVDRAGHPHGLTVPGGIISTTGVGGLTLGGGHGYLTRRYGLTIDNLLGAEVVLADGSRARANEKENPDLFWAIRGGGGNFGVVTSFSYRARPVRTVIGGPMLWPVSETASLMRFFNEQLGQMSDTIYGFPATLTVPPGPPFPQPLHLSKMCGVVWACTAPADETAAVLDRFRAFRKPAFEMVGELPMPAINSMFDALFVPGLHWYWKGDFFAELSDEAIGVHAKFAETLPTMLSTMHLYPVDGAASRVSPDATAWAHRSAKYSGVIVAVDPDPAANARATAWVKDYWKALHPHSMGAAYINFMMDDEGQDRVKATYSGNFKRLAGTKATYDPTNLFRVNQNIAPA